MSFKLHPQLQTDCYDLGVLGDCTLLLNKNALLPWFILVPHTTENELYKLESHQQSNVQNSINKLAQFVESHFITDKLNIATIGNIVPQLHIHVIGRFKNDFCWPQPVWGQSEFTPYNDNKLDLIKQALLEIIITPDHSDHLSR
ncbi:MAG: HIT domain-containing protein [Gammaproteobacteria bacterium]|nr:HIT domain-containing protein [Gammaproteobacteria bacterium]